LQVPPERLIHGLSYSHIELIVDLDDEKSSQEILGNFRFSAIRSAKVIIETCVYPDKKADNMSGYVATDRRQGSGRTCGILP
jgi:hypothetical protein